MIKRILILLMLVAGLVSCGKTVDTKEDVEIKDAVRKYDEALIKVYSILDTKPLDGLASEKEIGKVRMIIWKFLGEKKFMESELLELKFEKVRIKDKDSAEVETFERWRYRHINKDTRKVVFTKDPVEYRLSYEMVKENGIWVVEAAEFLK